jgi:tRNA pseudouridine38-40 synthase
LLGEAVRVVPAGRTDAGVHAEHQVVHVDTSCERTSRKMLGGLNHFLPEAIACWGASIVDPEFHARHTKHSKTYRYRIMRGATPSPLRRNRVWHVRQRLDVEAMQAAAALVVGTHDFSAFRAAGCFAAHPFRTLEGLTVVPWEDELHIEAHGTGFLRYMVRNLVGSLVEVGLGREAPPWIAQVLASRDRTRAARTAPADGLVLRRVTYGAETPVRA